MSATIGVSEVMISNVKSAADSPLVCIALQALLLAQALLLSLGAAAPAVFLSGVAVAGAAGMLCVVASAWNRPRLDQIAHVALSAAAAVLLGSVIATREVFSPWTFSCALIVAILAAMFWLAARRIEAGKLRRRWAGTTIAWAHAATVIWIGAAYLENRRLAFHLALFVWLVLWIALKRRFLLRPWAIQAANTAILLIVAVPLLSFVHSPSEALDVPPDLRERPYRYENARKDPAAYARWIRHYHEQWLQFLTATLKPGVFLPRPGAKATFFDSAVSINSKGFRGPEIPAEKGGAYRIVALGESTTFGVTLEAGEKSWPRILEAMIRTQLKPRRPVQVINAGVPSRNLEENLARVPEILALQPDMILSYHGFNGFKFIYDGMPPVRGVAVPRYKRRPVKMLADLEHRLAIRAYRQRHEKNHDPMWGDIEEPRQTQYAALYRELIEIAATNRIALVLATYSMAVNEASPREVIEFYRITFLQTDWQLKANAIHNSLVRSLAAEHPEVLFADTTPHLDARPENFIDLVHFTPEGKEKMAEIMYAAIEETLEEALAPRSR